MYSVVFLLFFFFFQAEDGIRDLTCDWSSDVCSSDLEGTQWEENNIVLRIFAAAKNSLALLGDTNHREHLALDINFFTQRFFVAEQFFGREIGRASCRERV